MAGENVQNNATHKDVEAATTHPTEFPSRSLQPGEKYQIEQGVVTIVENFGVGHVAQVYLVDINGIQAVLKLQRSDKAHLARGGQAIQIEASVLEKLNAAEIKPLQEVMSFVDRSRLVQETVAERSIVALLGSGKDSAGKFYQIQELAPPEIQRFPIQSYDDEVRIFRVMLKVAEAMKLAHDNGFSLKDFRASKLDRIRVDWEKPDDVKVIDWNITGGTLDLEPNPELDRVYFGVHLYNLLLGYNKLDVWDVTGLPQDLTLLLEQWRELSYFSQQILLSLLNKDATQRYRDDTQILSDLKLAISVADMSHAELMSACSRFRDAGDTRRTLMVADIGLERASTDEERHFYEQIFEDLGKDAPVRIRDGDMIGNSDEDAASLSMEERKIWETIYRGLQDPNTAKERALINFVIGWCSSYSDELYQRVVGGAVQYSIELVIAIACQEKKLDRFSVLIRTLVENSKWQDVISLVMSTQMQNSSMYEKKALLCVEALNRSQRIAELQEIRLVLGVNHPKVLEAVSLALTDLEKTASVQPIETDVSAQVDQEDKAKDFVTASDTAGAKTDKPSQDVLVLDSEAEEGKTEFSPIQLPYSFPENISAGERFIIDGADVEIVSPIGGGAVSLVFLVNIDDKQAVLKLPQLGHLFPKQDEGYARRVIMNRYKGLQVESEALLRLNSLEEPKLLSATSMVERLRIADETKNRRHIISLLAYGHDQSGMPFVVQELSPEERVQLLLEGSPAYEFQILTIMRQVAQAIKLAHQQKLTLSDFGNSKDDRVRVDYSDPDHPHVKIIDWNITGGLGEFKYTPKRDWVYFGAHLYKMLLPGRWNPLSGVLISKRDDEDLDLNLLPQDLSQVEDRENQWKQLTWVSKRILRRILSRQSQERDADTIDELFSDIDYLETASMYFDKPQPAATSVFKAGAKFNLDMEEYERALIDADLGLRVATEPEDILYFLSVVDLVNDPDYSIDELPDEVSARIKAVKAANSLVTTELDSGTIISEMPETEEGTDALARVAEDNQSSPVAIADFDTDKAIVIQETAMATERAQRTLHIAHVKLLEGWLNEHRAKPGGDQEDITPLFTSQEETALEALTANISNNGRTFETMDISVKSENGVQTLYALIKLGNDAAERISQQVILLKEVGDHDAHTVLWLKQEIVRLCVTQLQAYRVALKVLENSNLSSQPKLQALAADLQSRLAIGERNVKEILAEPELVREKAVPSPSELIPSQTTDLIIHPTKGGPKADYNDPYNRFDRIGRSADPGISLKDYLKSQKPKKRENTLPTEVAPASDESSRQRQALYDSLTAVVAKSPEFKALLTESKLQELIKLFERLNKHDTPSASEIRTYYPLLGQLLGGLIAVYTSVDTTLSPHDFSPSQDPEDVSTSIANLLNKILELFSEKNFLVIMKQAGDGRVAQQGRLGLSVSSDDYLSRSWMSAESQWQSLTEQAGVNIDTFLDLLRQIQSYISVNDLLPPLVLKNINPIV